MTAAPSATPARAAATWIGHACGVVDPVVFTVPEAAAVLRVSDQLIYELIHRGDLPAIELGRRRLIPRKAIDMVVDRALEGFDVDRVVAAIQSTR